MSIDLFKRRVRKISVERYDRVGSSSSNRGGGGGGGGGSRFNELSGTFAGSDASSLPFVFVASAKYKSFIFL
jgi:hypothetical protein